MLSSKSVYNLFHVCRRNTELLWQAGDTLFRVPVNYLPMDEGIFEDMFSLPNAGKEGNDDDNPIVLPEQVTAEDFRSFLKFIFPSYVAP